jgi:hypothetical protein
MRGPEHRRMNTENDDFVSGRLDRPTENVIGRGSWSESKTQGGDPAAHYERTDDQGGALEGGSRPLLR